jgi:hypothetical protein
MGAITTYTSNGVIPQIPELKKSVHDIALIIGGQSNADGRGLMDTNISLPHQAVYSYNKNNVYGVATEPLGTKSVTSGWVNNIPDGVTPGETYHSFGVELAKRLVIDAGINSLLIPCAIGSTDIAMWLPGSNPYDIKTLFGAMNTRAKLAVDAGITPVFAWFGHEGGGGTGYALTESLTTGIQDNEYVYAWILLVNAIRKYYPDAPILFAQVGANSTDVLTTSLRGHAESQRRTEATFGSANPVVYTNLPVTTDPNYYAPLNTNATNTIAVEGTGIRLVSDNSQSVGFIFGLITAGQSVTFTVTHSGTGALKFLCGTTSIAAGVAAGTHTYTVPFSSTGVLYCYRNAASGTYDLLITITAISIDGSSIQPTYIDLTPHAFSNTSFVVQNANATNTATAEGNGVRLVSDNGSAVGFNIATLAVDEQVLMDITVTGTGTWKPHIGSSDIYASFGIGSFKIPMIGTGTGLVSFFRAAACNLLFIINSITPIATARQKNTYMVVTHDVPHNASTDNIHVSTVGQKVVGQRFSKVYRKYILGETLNASGPRLLTTSPITKSGTTITVKFDSIIVAPIAGQEHWSPAGTAATSNFRVYYDGVEKTITNAALKSGDATMIELTVPTVSGVVVVTYGERAQPTDGTSYRKGVVYDADGMPAPVFGPIIAV